MSELSETQQASIVFLGRKTFRMEVVAAPTLALDADGIPEAAWESQTQRIIERRKSPPIERRRSPAIDRRQSPPGVGDVEGAAPVTTLARNTVIAASLILFVGGALVATAADRLRRHLRPESSAPVALVQPAPAPPAPAPAPAVVVQPLSAPEPAPAPASSPPAITPPPPAPHATARPAVVKVAAARAAAPTVGRTRRQTPAAATAPRRTTEGAATGPAAAKPTSASKWVDPFAD